MSNYKLTYFNITGLGESIRFLLHYGGIKFEDNRIESEDWPKLKQSAPMAQLPILEIDGKQYYQTIAISRYLGKKFNIAGANEVEAMQIDAIVDSIVDLRLALFKYHSAKDEEKDKLKEETFKKLNFYLTKLDETIKNNGGYFVGGKSSWADVWFAPYPTMMSMMAQKDITEGYPNLKALVDKVLAIPNIKKYVEVRPKTAF